MFHIGSVLQGRDSTSLKKTIVQAFSRGIFNTCARCSVYKGQPHCGMKQDVDTKSLLKMGMILAIFQSILTALTCRKLLPLIIQREMLVYPDVLCSS